MHLGITEKPMHYNQRRTVYVAAAAPAANCSTACNRWVIFARDAVQDSVTVVSVICDALVHKSAMAQWNSILCCWCITEMENECNSAWSCCWCWCVCVSVCRRIGAFERELSSTVNEILTALGHAPETTDNNMVPSVTPTPLIVPWLTSSPLRSVTWPLSHWTCRLNSLSLCDNLQVLPWIVNWQVADFALHQSTYCFISLILHISVSRAPMFLL